MVCLLQSKQKAERRGRRTNEEITRPFREKIEELEKLLEQSGTEDVEKDLSFFERFLNIVRGKVDAKYRLRLLLEPDNILTTTRLTRGERDFVVICNFASKNFKESGFGGLADFSKELCMANISLDGLGRREAIEYEGAISEAKLLKGLNLFKTEEAPKAKTEK